MFWSWDLKATNSNLLMLLIQSVELPQLIVFMLNVQYQGDIAYKNWV